MSLKDYFTFGYITKTKGLKGEVYLKLAVNQAEKYLETESVYLEINRKPVPFFVLDLRIHPDRNSATLLLEDVESIDEARKLVKSSVYLPNDQKVEEEFTYADLQNYLILDKHLGELGEIDKIEQLPQQYIASLNYQQKEILIPLNDAFITKIDKQKQLVFVDLPKGLLDIYLI